MSQAEPIDEQSNAPFEASGTLEQWDADTGAGAIRLRDGRLAWVHISRISEPERYRANPGMSVHGTFEDATQDGFRLRAVSVSESATTG